MMQLGKFCDCCRHLGLGFDQSKNMYNGNYRQSSVVLGVFKGKKGKKRGWGRQGWGGGGGGVEVRVCH